MQGLEALPVPLELMGVVALHGVGVDYDLRVDPLNFCHLWGCGLVRSIIIMTHNRVDVNIIMSRTAPLRIIFEPKNFFGQNFFTQNFFGLKNFCDPKYFTQNYQTKIF